MLLPAHCLAPSPQPAPPPPPLLLLLAARVARVDPPVCARAT